MPRGRAVSKPGKSCPQGLSRCGPSRFSGEGVCWLSLWVVCNTRKLSGGQFWGDCLAEYNLCWYWQRVKPVPAPFEAGRISGLSAPASGRYPPSSPALPGRFHLPAFSFAWEAQRCESWGLFWFERGEHHDRAKALAARFEVMRASGVTESELPERFAPVQQRALHYWQGTGVRDVFWGAGGYLSPSLDLLHCSDLNGWGGKLRFKNWNFTIRYFNVYEAIAAAG